MKYQEVYSLTEGTNQNTRRLSENAVLKLMKQSVLGFFYIDIFATGLVEKVDFAVIKRLLRCCYEY